MAKKVKKKVSKKSTVKGGKKGSKKGKKKTVKKSAKKAVKKPAPKKKAKAVKQKKPATIGNTISGAYHVVVDSITGTDALRNKMSKTGVSETE